jgi:murein DD-endopeptidase MepM/ murein hydrolase activator NlpD
LLLVVIVTALLVASAATIIRCEGSPPEMTGPAEVALGRGGGTVTVEVRDGESGLREVRALLVHDRGKTTLAEHTFPGELLRGGGAAAVEPLTLELVLEPKALGLQEGEALIRISARDWSWRGGLEGNEDALEIPLRIDLTPPRVRVRSGLTYIRRGGSAAVVYDVDADSVRDGVQVGDAFFAGHPLPGAGKELAGRKLGLFGVPRNAEQGVRVRVVSDDGAGNRRAAGWATRIQERSFEDVRIKLPQRFLDQKVRELAAEVGVEEADPVSAFQKLNTEVRAANEQRISEIVAGSRPEKLWEGAFVQMPNSRVTSRFAEERTYLVEGREVSEAIHYGYDLASHAHAPIVAANRGRVLFVGDLGIYGQTVILDHGGGLTSLYGHLSSLDVGEGDLVEKGDELGRSGETGLAGGDHLHFAIQLGGVYVDPLEWWDAKWVREHVEVQLGGG